MPVYNHRTKKLISFEYSNAARYEQHATREGLTFSEWINKLCARACKPDARQINNRDRKAARRGE